MKLLDSLSERFGLNAYAQGDYERAEKWFRRLERTEPESPRVLRNLGVILLARGDSEGAASYLRREEALYGESYQRHRSLADIAYAAGDARGSGRRYAAAAAFPEAAREPDAAFLAARLAVCRDAKLFERARKAAEAFSAGERQRDVGDRAAAYESFTEAAELDPTHWPALNNAGAIALSERGDPEAALGHFRRAAALVRHPLIVRNIAAAEAEIAKKVARKEHRK